MKKILITGGAGFIGCHLANKLLEGNYQIDLIDNFSRGVHDRDLAVLSGNKRVNLINIDLLDPKIVEQYNTNYSYIYHLAAIIGVQHVLKSPFSVLQNNFTLLQNAICVARRQKKLERFLFASTSEVYAGTLDYYGIKFPTPEITPLTIGELTRPRTSYMLSKIYGEAMCYHSSLPMTIIRPHNFYGPRMGLSHVIPELMKKVMDADNGYLDVASVEHKRTFCYIEDAVKMIQLLAETTEADGRTYNIGNDDNEITMGELAHKIINLTGKSVVVNPLPPTPGSPERRLPDISKLKKTITYNKQYSLEKGLQETFVWYCKNVFAGQGVSAK